MKTKKQFLFCPGPVNISQNVKDAVHNEIGHREVEFSHLVTSLNKKLLKIYEIKSTKAYHPVFITGSGTAANEAVLSSIVHGKNILIISNGEFGERLFEISKIHNPENTFLLDFGWAQEIDVKRVEEFVKENNIQIIAMVHHETSTGMLNHLDKVGRLAEKHNLTFVVDTVSSVGAEKINIEKWNITFTTGTSGKAIGSLPGVAFVIARKSDFESLRNFPAKTMYLNLYKFYCYSINFAQTPNTPAVQLFFAFEQALSNIISEGIVKRRKHVKDMTGVLREGLNDLGLTFIIPTDKMSSVLTTVRLPKYISVDTLKSKLREKNIVIYNGKGPLKDKVFQVGNIGAIDRDNVSYFIFSIANVLNEARETQGYAKQFTRISTLTSSRQISGNF